METNGVAITAASNIVINFFCDILSSKFTNVVFSRLHAIALALR